MNRIQCELKAATPETVREYGTLIDISDREPTVDRPDFRYWDEVRTAGFGGDVSFGVVESRPGPLVSRALERHLSTVETLIPMDGDVILVLGKPTDAPLPDMTAVGAFLLKRGTAVILHPGIWHLAPLTENGTVRTLVLFARGTLRDDLTFVDLEKEMDTVIEVDRG